MRLKTFTNGSWFRVIPLFAYILVGLSFIFQSAQASTPERALVDKLHDIEALTSAGISYEEYSRQITEMILLSEKCKRAKGCGSNFLQGSVDWLIEAKAAWNEKITTDSEEMREIKGRQIHIKWKLAFIVLEKYDKEKGRK